MATQAPIACGSLTLDQFLCGFSFETSLQKRIRPDPVPITKEPGIFGIQIQHFLELFKGLIVLGGVVQRPDSGNPNKERDRVELLCAVEFGNRLVESRALVEKNPVP